MAAPSKASARSLCDQLSDPDFNPLYAISYDVNKLSNLPKPTVRCLKAHVLEKTKDEQAKKGSQAPIGQKQESETQENENKEKPSDGENKEQEKSLPKHRAKRNVLTRMINELSVGPLSLLHRSVAENIRIKVWTRSFRHVRGICTGYLVAFDKHFNLAMVDVDEIYRKPVKKYFRPSRNTKVKVVSGEKPEDTTDGKESKKVSQVLDQEGGENRKAAEKMSEGGKDVEIDALTHQMALLKQQLLEMSDQGEEESGDMVGDNERTCKQEALTRKAGKMGESKEKEGKKDESSKTYKLSQQSSRSYSKDRSESSYRSTRSSHSQHDSPHDVKKSSRERESTSDRYSHRHTKKTDQREHQRSDSSSRSGNSLESSRSFRDRPSEIENLTDIRPGDKRSVQKSEHSRSSKDKENDKGTRKQDEIVRYKSRKSLPCDSRHSENISTRSSDYSRRDRFNEKQTLLHKNSENKTGSHSDNASNQPPSTVLQRHVNQLFIRGEQVVMVALDPVT